MTLKMPNGAHGELPVLDQPFNRTPNPRYFYLAPQYRLTLNHAIGTVVEKDGLTIIAGPIGCGKSTMCRYLVEWLLDRLGDTLCLIQIPNPNFSSDFQLLKAICKEVDIQPKATKAEQMEAFREFLYQKDQDGATTLLLIDEAHRLTGPQFELVREFFNFCHNERFYLQVVLSGEEIPLHHKLKNKKAILSRSAYYDILQPLTEVETGELIRFRFRVSGMNEDIFTAEAISRVWKEAKGSPRNVVKIGRAIFSHFENLDEVTLAMVDEILALNPRLATDA